MESMVEQILQEKKISEPEVISKETTWNEGRKKSFLKMKSIN